MDQGEVASIVVGTRDLASHRRHLLEFRRGRIEPVPGMTAHRIRHHLRLVSAWIVEARGVNGEEVRHGREGQIDGRPAGWAEAARLHVPAVADHVPMRRFALELHRLPAREGQIGSVPGAARTLAVAALAVVHRNRLGPDFIADRPPGAPPRCKACSCLSPNKALHWPRRFPSRQSFPSTIAPMFWTTFFQPSLMLLKAVSFFGRTKPEWTRRRRVPFSTLESMNVTTVSSREPYPTFPSCPPFQA